MATLLKYNLGACVLIFLLLEIWRPCYFLTDDNLAGSFPSFTEMGRDLQRGHSPFIQEYLFGGNYDQLRDVGSLYWHPFYLLPTLLADTFARFWMLDITALLFLLFTTTGFTLLIFSLRQEYDLQISDTSLVFYTVSYVFSTYILYVGASWIGFFGNQCALPWLALGILDKKLLRGTLLILVFSIQQLLGSCAALTLSSTLCLTLFALGASICRQSTVPLFSWFIGNIGAVLVLFPLLLRLMVGFAYSFRAGGLSLKETTEFNVPASMFSFSFFFGNWTEPLTKSLGDSSLVWMTFPYCPTLLACAAAWCLVPAFFHARWRPMEILCLGITVILAVLIIRPHRIAIAMQHLPVLRSMRWPFREILQFQFFVHLFMILRPQVQPVKFRTAIVLLSVAAFILPLPFIRVPTFNALFVDRRVIFSGEAERFWARVKTQLKPTDEVATVIDPDFWDVNHAKISYALLCTANFPCLYKIVCVTGYSTTAPRDQVPLTVFPRFWFGAFQPSQVSALLAQKPDLKLIRIESLHPLKITLSSGAAPPVDITHYLQPDQK